MAPVTRPRCHWVIEVSDLALNEAPFRRLQTSLSDLESTSPRSHNQQCIRLTDVKLCHHADFPDVVVAHVVPVICLPYCGALAREKKKRKGKSRNGMTPLMSRYWIYSWQTPPLSIPWIPIVSKPGYLRFQGSDVTGSIQQHHSTHIRDFWGWTSAHYILYYGRPPGETACKQPTFRTIARSPRFSWHFHLLLLYVTFCRSFPSGNRQGSLRLLGPAEGVPTARRIVPGTLNSDRQDVEGPISLRRCIPLTPMHD
jgi:hypothetical protein